MPSRRPGARRRICNLPDRYTQRRKAARWHPAAAACISWHVSNGLPRFPRRELIHIFHWAWNQITPLARLGATYTGNHKTAHVVIRCGLLDGAGDALAESYLPDEDTLQLEQLYDFSEPWEFDEKPAKGRIDIGRVVIHELLHALGVGHYDGDEPSIMSPYYDETIREPQAWEVRQLLRKYPHYQG